MQIGEFLVEIDNLGSSSDEVNDTSNVAVEKDLNQSWSSRSSAMILGLY